jgi:hypothetical protein
MTKKENPVRIDQLKTKLLAERPDATEAQINKAIIDSYEFLDIDYRDHDLPCLLDYLDEISSEVTHIL